jgi:hypothetical protein
MVRAEKNDEKARPPCFTHNNYCIIRSVAIPPTGTYHGAPTMAERPRGAIHADCALPSSNADLSKRAQRMIASARTGTLARYSVPDAGRYRPLVHGQASRCDEGTVLPTGECSSIQYSLVLLSAPLSMAAAGNNMLVIDDNIRVPNGL